MTREHAQAFADGYFDALEKAAELPLWDQQFYQEAPGLPGGPLGGDSTIRKATDSLTKATERMRQAHQTMLQYEEAGDEEAAHRATLELERAQSAMYAAKARYQSKIDAERNRLKMT